MPNEFFRTKLFYRGLLSQLNMQDVEDLKSVIDSEINRRKHQIKYHLSDKELLLGESILCQMYEMIIDVNKGG